ncbi:hypothetical protein MPLDJ20_110075 [Mesorhizobium plurifarium]|uniref:Uncharacterized protein n=1 Tax=Mesorhizobium plurifarium TaxID=69974 RepID=A0A090DL43_MESPL|nr:hypothetical protein MPLDJ20_110075 [Mesorhizobium plurifarium]
MHTGESAGERAATAERQPDQPCICIIAKLECMARHVCPVHIGPRNGRHSPGLKRI